MRYEVIQLPEPKRMAIYDSARKAAIAEAPVDRSDWLRELVAFANRNSDQKVVELKPAS